MCDHMIWEGGGCHILESSYAEHNVWSYDMGRGLKIVKDITGV